jgi:hypothetical protein
MVVECGGGTVDLTTRRLLRDNKLSEITERTGDFCGGSYIDQEFLKFLRKWLDYWYKFRRFKSMFDPVIGKIIRLIHGKLSSSKDKCSAIFLVGEFSESKYLQIRVTEN